MTATASPSLNVKVRGVIRLTRWKEYVLYIIPLTVCGALLAVQTYKGVPDWRLMIGLIANTLVMAYAFMINDIEDAPDDALEAHRAARNPISCGELSAREGWLASGAVALITLMLYALLGTWPFVIGAITLAFSHFYSWKPVRLKKWPVTDVVSHSLMLSGLPFLVGYFTYHTAPGAAWLVALALTLVSVYGQLYNQIRDFSMDKAAGLKNTAIMVGQRNTQLLMYLAVGSAVVMLAIALLAGIFPLWIVIAPIVAAPVVFYLLRSKQTDMRGGKSADVTGDVQLPMILLANCAVIVWLVVVLLRIA